MQILAVESCSLTDLSLIYLASIIKAQESNLDALYWNSTLRLDFQDYNRQQIIEETNSVYGKGLVGISIWGNKITGSRIADLMRVLKKNNWLLGKPLSPVETTRANLNPCIL